jgi:hypothetical protein
MGTKLIRKIKRIEILSCEEPKGDNTKTQYAPTESMVVDERDVFDVFTPLRHGAVINDKVALFTRIVVEVELLRDRNQDFVHK